MSTKKLVSIVTILIAVTSMLAACATPTAAPTQAPAPATAAPATVAPATAAPATAAPATAAPAKKFTIGISNSFISSEYRTQMIDELKDCQCRIYGAGHHQ